LKERLDYFKDPNFRFNEDSHTYTYLENGKPVQTFTSVTGFISFFKQKFDQDFWSKKKAKQLGVSQDSILTEWKENSERAMGLGTQVHKWIEDFYNGDNPALPTDPNVLERVNAFQQLHSEKLYKFTPVAQEFRLFSRKWGLAGTTDAIFELNGKYYIGDWKTNGNFTTDNDKCYQKLKYPFDHLWENALNSYSIQLSLYRLILEEEAGFKTSGAFLAWIGPNLKPKLYNTVDLTDALRNFLHQHKKNI
jgi:ATP-dependent exoDNAse (exonuclease V) beta subunit